MGTDGMPSLAGGEMAAIRGELDEVARDLASSIDRITTEANRSIQEAATAALNRGLALSRRLARAEIVRMLDGTDAEGRGTRIPVERPGVETNVPPGSGQGRMTESGTTSTSRASSREVILGALIEAGGSMSKETVRERVLAAGWTESAYKKMNVRLRRRGAIADDGATWMITDEGREQAGRIEDGPSGSTVPMQGEGEM